MAGQKIVVILGSASDLSFAHRVGDFLSRSRFQVECEYKISSAHRNTEKLLEDLKTYELSGGRIVYITIAGLSDALSGIVAGNSKHPVLACPPDLERHGFPKAFSSMMMPTGIAVSLVASPENAALIAVKTLALCDSSLMKRVTEYMNELRSTVAKADADLKSGRVKGASATWSMLTSNDAGKRGVLEGILTREEIVTETNLPFPIFKRGKVRDVYDLKDRLLIVSTDRISAFDVVLPNGIPHKGEALNRLSNFWFDKTREIVPNHVLDIIDPRTVLVQKTEPIKIEFVVRGYLYGSLWENYRKGKVTSLPEGLEKAEKLFNPILTPTTKADIGHDTELSKEDVQNQIGKPLATEIEEASIKIYELASKKAEKSGIIVADTKLEFGIFNNELMLIDECLTPDSSRFWSKSKYRTGQDQFSYDKQYVRDYLIEIGWNKTPPAPKLPERIIAETSKKYVEAYERLTGRKF